MIKFLGGGNIAVVTFFHHTNRIFHIGTSEELVKKYTPNTELIMIVPEKQMDGQWLIVATHD
jgi:hypothetical protein